MQILIFLSLFSLPALAATGADQYAGKYMYTSHDDPKIKEYNTVVSDCFKISDEVMKVLESYDLCDGNVIKQAPLKEAIGHCVRKKDSATGYIFETMKACKTSQSDAAGGASS